MLMFKLLPKLCGIFLFVLFLIPLGQSEAHDIIDIDTSALSGVYELKEVTAAGVYSSGEEAEAQDFVGHFLTIHGDHVVLPTAELCHINSMERRTLKNDRDSFGTAGGSWSEVGLKKTSDYGYDVTELSFDCSGPFSTMIAQPESGTYLLSYWGVYHILGRE
ncbi:MAG: hypothetical protein P1V34_16680 [Alphaproteobacteria bacterium]|nr:hypothetical protein [Alphaproteobacteria bacterium]